MALEELPNKALQLPSTVDLGLGLAFPLALAAECQYASIVGQTHK